jgi:hypothetical protein
MEPRDPKIAELEAEDLKVHVAASHMRYEYLEQSILRVEKAVEKSAAENKESIDELKKVVIWAASTLFATMLIALLSSVFKGLL